jgi:hypothetical protein
VDYASEIQDRIDVSKASRADNPAAIGLLVGLEQAIASLLAPDEFPESRYARVLKLITDVSDAVSNLSEDEHEDWSDLVEILELLRQLAFTQI